MDENNTTPESNVPDLQASDKPEKPISDKNNPKSQFDELYKNKKSDYQEYSWNHYAHENKEATKPKPTVNAYEEIVEDLIDIIAKLLKELSKRK